MSEVEVYISQPLATGDVDTGPRPAACYTQRTHAFTQQQQHDRFLTDQLPLYVCTVRPQCVFAWRREASVCLCKRNAFILTRQSRACSLLSKSIQRDVSLSLSLSQTHVYTHILAHTHTHMEEHTWGKPGRSVIGLNDLRNNKRPFSFLVRSSFGCIAH